jgi:hypothetical protein
MYKQCSLFYLQCEMAPQHKTEVQAVSEAIQAGMRLAHPPPGEEVVISGVSGCFPDSSNVYHLRDNLMNKVDMVSGDHRRWKLGLYTYLLISVIL